MTDRVPFVGIGTGRCGTDTLHRIVDACDNTAVTHEKFGSRWYDHDPILWELTGKMEHLRGAGILVGEVQCQLGSHVWALRERVPDLKVVCLHRPKQEVVKSYLSSDLFPLFRPMDRAFFDAKCAKLGIRSGSLHYPIIDAATQEQSVGFWWELYEGLMSQIEGPVYHFEMKWFNDDKKLGELLDWLEVPECDRNIPEKRKWNSTEERLARKESRESSGCSPYV